MIGHTVRRGPHQHTTLLAPAHEGHAVLLPRPPRREPRARRRDLRASHAASSLDQRSNGDEARRSRTRRCDPRRAEASVRGPHRRVRRRSLRTEGAASPCWCGRQQPASTANCPIQGARHDELPAELRRRSQGRRTGRSGSSSTDEPNMAVGVNIPRRRREYFEAFPLS